MQQDQQGVVATGTREPVSQKHMHKPNQIQLQNSQDSWDATVNCSACLPNHDFCAEDFKGSLEDCKVIGFHAPAELRKQRLYSNKSG